MTLPWGHATEGTISHPDVLRCGISNRSTSAGVKTRIYRIATFTAGSTSISGHPLTREEYSFARDGLPEPPLWVLPPHPPDVGDRSGLDFNYGLQMVTLR